MHTNITPLSFPTSHRLRRIAWLFAAVVLLSIATAVPLLAQNTAEFYRASSIDVGSNVIDVVAADFDRDGRLDLAVLDGTAATVTILRNLSDRFAVQTTLGAGIRPRQLIVGDFNHDDRVDLLVIASTPLLYRQPTIGSFRSPFFQPAVQVSGAGVGVAGGAVGDVNRDGHIDLIAMEGGNGLKFVAGTADGFVTTGVRIPSNITGASFHLTDIDQDGDLDIVYTIANGFHVLRNQGNATFAAPQVRTLNRRPGASALLKWTRDDTEDLVLAPATPNNPLTILRVADGLQVEIPSSQPVPEVFELRTADATGDGIPDLFLHSSATRSIFLLHNPNDLRFQSIRKVASTPQPGLGGKRMLPGDFNNDGLADLVVAQDNPNNVNGADQIVLYLNPDKGDRLSVTATRTLLSNGRTVLTGFVIDDVPTRVLIRAVGPGLAQFGITGFHPNPRFIVNGAAGEVGRNDNWSASTSNRDAVLQASRATGAFTLTPGSTDAATMLTLDPGSYTITTTGTGSGEVYIDVNVVEGDF